MIKTWTERMDAINNMQAEIDELRAALKAAESGPLSDEAFDIVTSENSALKAKLADVTEQTRQILLHRDHILEVNGKLAAKLASLETLYLNSLADATQWQLYKSRKDAVIAAGMGKKAMRDSAAGAAPTSQKPVAEVLLVDGEKVIDASMAFFDSVELGTKLYRAAGAAPVQQEPEPIQVCRLMKKEEGIWVAASEFYAGHPDQKWVKLVSTNPGSWSIQRRVTGKQIADGLAKALAGTPPALEVTECQWSFEDDDSGTWRSSCGELWSFIDGGPNENRVTYCHHCGGKVSNAAAAPAAKVPEEPRIDINDLSGMIAAVIKEQTP